jgi:hypothetical protein
MTMLIPSGGTLHEHAESVADGSIRAHRISTLKLLEAAYDYAHDCGNYPVLDDIRTRINRLKYTLGLDAITTGNADFEHEQEEKKEQGFRMFQGGA